MAKARKTRKAGPRAALGGDLLSEVGSSVVKYYAAQQPLQVRVTQAQVQALMDQLKAKDPTRPTEVTFNVAGKPLVRLKLAGYWYSGDTCCV